MNKYCYFCNENKHRIPHNKAKASIIVIFLQLLTKVVQDTIIDNPSGHSLHRLSVVNCLHKWYKILLDTTAKQLSTDED